MSTPTIATRQQWLEARRDLLTAEKEHTRQRDELARRRRALPWVRVDKDYRFDTETGPRSLAELFDDRSQLLVYHFMYGPDWTQGCPSCSFWADGFDGLDVHLARRDVTLVAASRAPLERLLDYRTRMGWTFPWVSSLGSDFNTDFDVSDAASYNYAPVPEADRPGERPGLSVFALDGEQVFHTYSCYARGLDGFNAAYQLLDLTPRGRAEDGLEWSMAWLRRHDEY
jgi:predicted dithiol-disulfide oxidoreductase (DUF899 family)